MALQYGRGLIPARAGNTLFPIPHCPAFGAHPRSRGEHKFFTEAPLFLLGSSPLARGTHGRTRILAHRMGLIPARAGNTLPSLATSECYWAHPRSRGEHRPLRRALRTLPGSSPLARGTRGVVCEKVRGAGLIPARAGNTNPPTALTMISGAHPRSRGEHFKARYAAAALGGSSPLARGTRYL